MLKYEYNYYLNMVFVRQNHIHSHPGRGRSIPGWFFHSSHPGRSIPGWLSHYSHPGRSIPRWFLLYLLDSRMGFFLLKTSLKIQAGRLLLLPVRGTRCANSKNLASEIPLKRKETDKIPRYRFTQRTVANNKFVKRFHV